MALGFEGNQERECSASLELTESQHSNAANDPRKSPCRMTRAICPARLLQAWLDPRNGSKQSVLVASDTDSPTMERFGVVSARLDRRLKVSPTLSFERSNELEAMFVRKNLTLECLVSIDISKPGSLSFRTILERSGNLISIALAVKRGLPSSGCLAGTLKPFWAKCLLPPPPCINVISVLSMRS